jgi:hypothetical protein
MPKASYLVQLVLIWVASHRDEHHKGLALLGQFENIFRIGFADFAQINFWSLPQVFRQFVLRQGIFVFLEATNEENLFSENSTLQLVQADTRTDRHSYRQTGLRQKSLKLRPLKIAEWRIPTSHSS